MGPAIINQISHETGDKDNKKKVPDKLAGNFFQYETKKDSFL
jgi:hypothetical protein